MVEFNVTKADQVWFMRVTGKKDKFIKQMTGQKFAEIHLGDKFNFVVRERKLEDDGSLSIGFQLEKIKVD